MDIAAVIKEFRETWIEFKKTKTMKFLFQILFTAIVLGVCTNLVVYIVKSANNKPSKFLWVTNGIQQEIRYVRKDSILYIHDTIYKAGRDLNMAKRDQYIKN